MVVFRLTAKESLPPYGRCSESCERAARPTLPRPIRIGAYSGINDHLWTLITRVESRGESLSSYSFSGSENLI